MNDNTVAIDRSLKPTGLRFASRFNVVVPFIDRHLVEGRAAKAAIRTAEGDVTYGELAERVGRCANGLLGLGLRSGERMMMVVKDAPEFFYLFWGAIRAGIVPVPLNTLLRHGDYQFMIDDSACAALVYSPEYAGEVEAALVAASNKPRRILKTRGTGDTVEALIASASSQQIGRAHV